MRGKHQQAEPTVNKCDLQTFRLTTADVDEPYRQALASLASRDVTVNSAALFRRPSQLALGSVCIRTTSKPCEDRGGGYCLVTDCGLDEEQYVSRDFENTVRLSTCGPSSGNPAVAVALSLSNGPPRYL
ncbi:predicted protein [Postia placenta Mad-698-R]|nr:predicted protein [Postia placenta Mad-698-R]